MVLTVLMLLMMILMISYDYILMLMLTGLLGVVMKGTRTGASFPWLTWHRGPAVN